MIDSTKHNYNIFKVIVILVLMCISHFSLLAQNPGDLIWESKVSHQYKWGLPLRLSMNSTDGTIYYGSSALNGKTGKLLWSSEKSPYRQFSVGKNYLYSFNILDAGNVNAVNKKNGKIVWKYKTRFITSYETYNGSSIGIDDNEHIYFGDGCYFYCVNGSTGKLIWEFNYDHIHLDTSVKTSLGNDGIVVDIY